MDLSRRADERWRNDDGRVVCLCPVRRAQVEQVMVRCEQRLGRPAVIPVVHRERPHLLACVHHQLQAVGEPEFPPRLPVLPHQAVQRVGQRGGVADVIDADEREVRGRVLRLLDELRDPASGIDLHDPHAPGVVYFLHPGKRFLPADQPGQIPFNDGIAEHQHNRRSVQMRAGDVDGMTIAQGFFLHDKGQLHPLIVLTGERFDLFSKVADDEHHLVDPDRGQLVDDVGEDRLPRDVHQGLGLRVGVRAQPRAESGDGDDGLHVSGPSSSRQAGSFSSR